MSTTQKGNVVPIRTGRILRWLLTPALAILLISLSACGGGSVSTEGNYTRVLRGVVSDSSSQPLPDCEISVTETGDTVRSDTDGAFEIRFSSSSSVVELLVRNQETEGIVTLENIPAGEQIIEVSLRVDSDNGQIVVTSLDIRYIDETPAATPTATVNQLPQKDQVRRVLVSGTFTLSDGFPITEADVGIAGSKVSDQTDEHGKFELSTTTSSRSISLSVDYYGAKGRLEIDNLPPNRDIRVNMRVVWYLKDSANSPIPKIRFKTKKLEITS